MNLERLFGGSPLAVTVKLVIMSIVVGIVLSAIGLSVSELFYRLDLILRRIYDLGFGWLEWLFRYFLLGAVIVIPIWLVARLLGAFNRK